MKIRSVVALLAGVFGVSVSAAHSVQANDGTIKHTGADHETRIALGASQPPAACSTAEYRQFDFFAGDWDTYDVGKPETIVAHNHVTPMVGGCALREVYEGTDGLRGESFSTYDTGRHIWHQSWVTNRGSMLLLEGTWDGTRMVLIAPERQADGTTSLLRGTWWREAPAVRERAERSRDNGATWTPVFDLVFRPHRVGR